MSIALLTPDLAERSQRQAGEDHRTASAATAALPPIEQSERFSAAEIALVERCLNGEETACSELYARYYADLMPICMRYARNTDDAKDILQEGFIRIFSKLNTYSGKGHFIGWLKRVMVNAAINHHHASTDDRLHVRMEDLPRSETLRDADVDEEAISRLAVDELLHLVQALPPAYRTVFNLRVMEGWSHEEIAQELQISVGTSKSNLNRARAKLIEQIAATDGTVTHHGPRT